MKNNNKGFSIVIAMGLVVLISLLAISILEYIIPFSKNVKGIENSANSYYQATSAVENALWFIKSNTLGKNDSTIIPNTATGFNYNIIADGSILPPAGKGNSDFNKNWNTISSGNPIQLEIGYGKITSTVFKIKVRVPDIDGTEDIIESFSGTTQSIINWQLSSQLLSLNSNGSNITGSDIYDSNINSNAKDFQFSTKAGIQLDGTTSTLGSFHTSNCGFSQSCILKLSVINKLEWEYLFKSGKLPYLEWKIITSNNNTNKIPLRYTNIEANGKSFSYKKTLNVRVPQKTTIDAFNFTIFQ